MLCKAIFVVCVVMRNSWKFSYSLWPWFLYFWTSRLSQPQRRSENCVGIIRICVFAWAVEFTHLLEVVTTTHCYCDFPCGASLSVLHSFSKCVRSTKCERGGTVLAGYMLQNRLQGIAEWLIGDTFKTKLQTHTHSLTQTQFTRTHLLICTNINTYTATCYPK